MGNTKIGISNFKAFGPKMQYFTKKPITLIYGPNSVGKSSLIHALGYRNQILRVDKYDLRKVDIGDSVEFTSFTNFIHKKDSKSKITFEYNVPEYNASLLLQVGRKDDFKIKDLIEKYIVNNETFLEVEYIANDEYCLSLNTRHPLIVTKYLDFDSDEISSEVLKINIHIGNNRLFCNITSFEFQSIDAPEIEKMLFENALKYIFNITTAIHKSKKFCYVEPLRYYPNASDVFKDDVQANQNDSSKLFWLNLVSNLDLVNNLNNWLSNKIFCLPYEIKIENIVDTKRIPDFENILNITDEYIKANFPEAVGSFVVFVDKRTSTQVHNREIGLGLTQLLPIISKSFLEKNSIIAIEQPELHLHPALQCEIADVFIQSSKQNNNEFMIESHSEHLLLRIMKRMRQTAEGTLEDESLRLTPDDVCLLYVDNDGESTYLQELRLSEKGTLLDHWPHGFFEEGYKERFS